MPSAHLQNVLRVLTQLRLALRRYSSRDQATSILPNLVEHLLPRLLELSQRILTPVPADTASLTVQGTLATLIIKAYKNSIAHTLTPGHQAHESIIPWGTLLLSIVQRQIPVELLPEDLDAREKHPWAKCKKWSLFALNKLFDRYGNPSQLPSNMKALYTPFAERFIAQFAPEILKTYLGVVERIVGGEWQSNKTKHLLLCFFEDWYVVFVV